LVQALSATTEVDVQALIVGNFLTQGTSQKDAVAENDGVEEIDAVALIAEVAMIGGAG